MDEVSEVISRIGAESPQEKEAWRKIIEGVTTVVFCQMKRRIASRPSAYNGLEDPELKTRIRENIVTWMLKVTKAVTEIRESLDYGRV